MTKILPQNDTAFRILILCFNYDMKKYVLWVPMDRPG